MKVKIEFACDNAAFGDNGVENEIRKVLAVATTQILNAVEGDGQDSGRVRDTNGNTIGKWKVTK